MRRFLGFVRKEFRHLLRDYRSLAILIGMPFAQVLLFGFIISTEIRNVPVAFHYAAHDAETTRLTNKILSSGYFTAADNIDDIHRIDDVFRKGTVKLVVLFGDDRSIQLIADASDANTASLVTSYAQSIIRDYPAGSSSNSSSSSNSNSNSSSNSNSRQYAVNTAYWQLATAYRQLPTADWQLNKGRGEVMPEVKMLYNPNMKSAYMFVPGIICLLLMLISAIMTSISIAREKELGTMEVLLVSPLRPVQIIIGKVIPYVIVAFVIGLIILTMGYTVFGMPFNGRVALLLAEFLLFITLALSLGILISTVTSSQQVALMISMFALLLPAILLSGFIFPIENMPVALQYLSVVMPPRWFIVVVKNIMLKGAGIAHVWKETLVLLGMTALLLTVSIKRFKIRLT
jgi:ABC-2 type transport system permease protein